MRRRLRPPRAAGPRRRLASSPTSTEQRARGARAEQGRTLHNAALRGDARGRVALHERAATSRPALLPHGRRPRRRRRRSRAWPATASRPIRLDASETARRSTTPIEESFAERVGLPRSAPCERVRRAALRRASASTRRSVPSRRTAARSRASALSDWKRTATGAGSTPRRAAAVAAARDRRGAAAASRSREFFRRGERTVALGVDAQNPTGATRLYERVGMRVVLGGRRSTQVVDG